MEPKKTSCLFQLKANDFLFSTELWRFSWSDDLNECQFWRFLSQRKQLPPGTTASVSPQAPKHKEGWQQASGACTETKWSKRPRWKKRLIDISFQKLWINLLKTLFYQKLGDPVASKDVSAHLESWHRKITMPCVKPFLACDPCLARRSFSSQQVFPFRV